MLITQGTWCVIYGNSLLSLQFFCKPKTILKEKDNLKSMVIDNANMELLIR